MPLKNRNSPKLIQKIDVTALASVMVVLVVALMIVDFTTATAHHGAGPELPRILHPLAMPSALREDAVTITVRRDGRIYVGSDEFPPDRLAEKLRQRFYGGVERKAYIRADARARYRDVKPVLDAIRAAGVENIGFMAEQMRAAPGLL